MCVILGLCGIITLAIVYNDFAIKLFQSFLEWMKSNIIYGSVAFMAIYIMCTILLIPGSWLTLGAGFVYDDIFGSLIGVSIATLIVWISASIGATFSFFNGRYLFRQCVVSQIAKKYKYFDIIEQIVKEYGFSVTFWLRLSSITPYNFFNYLMGITSVKSIDYILAHIGMMPDVCIYCFIGASISDIIEIAETGIADNVPFLIVLAITLCLSIIGIIFISYYAKQKFDKMVRELNNDNNMESDHDASDNTDHAAVSEMQIISIRSASNDKHSHITV